MLSESHLFYVLMLDSFVRVNRNYCVVTVYHFAMTMLIGQHQSPSSIIVILVTIHLEGWFLSLFDPILSWSFFSSILQNINTGQSWIFLTLSQFGIFFGFLFNDLILSGILYKTVGPALLDIIGSDLISDFFESEIILDSHGDSNLVAHGDVPELVRKVVATVNAHHLFAFLSPVRFYLLESFVAETHAVHHAVWEYAETVGFHYVFH